MFESVLDGIRRECVTEQLSRLKPRERDALKERYGFKGEPKTLEEVGQMWRVTRERVRQIEAKALKKLQHPSYKKKLEDFY